MSGKYINRLPRSMPADQTRALSDVFQDLHRDATQYQATANNAVVRPQREKLDDFVSVKDFGAAGDGVTDDTAAIVSALADATTSGLQLDFPDGTYLVGSAGWTGFSVSSKSNFALVGHGNAKIKVNAQPSQLIFATSSHEALFKFSSCSDFSVEGLKFEGNSIACAALSFDQCNRHAVRFCEFKNFTTNAAYGITTVRGNDGEILGNYFDNCGYAIFAGHTDTNYHENRLAVTANRAFNLAVDFCVGVMKNTNIVGNVAKTMGISGVAISGYNVNSAFSENVAVTGNVFLSPTSHGVQTDVVGAIENKNITIVGNVIEGAGGFGCYLPKIIGGAVSGNVIRDCNGGITLDAPGKRVAIAGNHIDSTSIAPTQDGILLHAENTVLGIEEVSVGCNTVRGFDAANKSGIALTHASTGTGANVSIVGNVCAANDRGISVHVAASSDYTGLTIAGNTAVGNTTVDLRCDVLDAVIGDNKYATESGVEFFTFADGDTTPSVKGRKFFRANNTGATTITTFDDGVNGQEVVVRCNNGNTTFAHSSSFVMKGAINVTPAADQYVAFRREGTVWREMSRSF